jgi:lipopolysaccharide/colanic/teichoic acid biosynthesis glycosyltransferase
MTSVTMSVSTSVLTSVTDASDEVQCSSSGAKTLRDVVGSAAAAVVVVIRVAPVALAVSSNSLSPLMA